MALGWFLRTGPDLYLLVGVPLTIAFQLLVRRRPLRALWVRDGPRFRLDRWGMAIAGALLVLPAISLVQAAIAREWVTVGWMSACAVGALAAAYALRQVRGENIRQVVRWTLIATAVGTAVIVATLAPMVATPQPVPMLVTGLQSALRYFPVTFVLEEVSFRGALDAHVHQPGERRAWMSALFSSVLWGLWHLPIAATGLPLVVTLGQVLIVHTIVGVPLALGWRRTGNLTAPALAHALIDGVRNGLMAGL